MQAPKLVPSRADGEKKDGEKEDGEKADGEKEDGEKEHDGGEDGGGELGSINSINSINLDLFTIGRTVLDFSGQGENDATVSQRRREAFRAADDDSSDAQALLYAREARHGTIVSGDAEERTDATIRSTGAAAAPAATNAHTPSAVSALAPSLAPSLSGMILRNGNDSNTDDSGSTAGSTDGEGVCGPLLSTGEVALVLARVARFTPHLTYLDLRWAL
jgi:hypothetical protein